MTGITVPKHITKAELYDHLEDLNMKRIDIITKKLKPKLQELSEAIYQSIKNDLEEAEAIRQALKELDLQFIYRATNSYQYNSISSDAYNMNTNAHSDFKRTMEARLNNKSTIIWKEEDIESRPLLNELTSKWNTEIEKYEKERKQSEKLKRELTQVVKSEKRAQKGFQLLVELGLDMSRFVPSKASVPAIIKPSVDISIFNDIEDK